MFADEREVLSNKESVEREGRDEVNNEELERENLGRSLVEDQKLFYSTSSQCCRLYHLPLVNPAPPPLLLTKLTFLQTVSSINSTIPSLSSFIRSKIVVRFFFCCSRQGRKGTGPLRRELKPVS